MENLVPKLLFHFTHVCFCHPNFVVVSFSDPTLLQFSSYPKTLSNLSLPFLSP
ncbi:hypothetical protein Hanom_Chr06g00506101 [Helianthus anomalus]